MLDRYDLDIIGGGGAKRLHIPMGDKFIWRICAEQLRSLATQLDVYSRLPPTEELSERNMHVIIKGMIDSANRVMKQAADQAGLVIADGRPKGRKSKERSADNTRTDETDGRSLTQVVELQALKH